MAKRLESFIHDAYWAGPVDMSVVLEDSELRAILEQHGYVSKDARRAQTLTKRLLKGFLAQLEEDERQDPGQRSGKNAPISERQQAIIVGRLMFLNAPGDKSFRNHSERRDAAVHFPKDLPLTVGRVSDGSHAYRKQFLAQLEKYLETLPRREPRLEVTASRLSGFQTRLRGSLRGRKLAWLVAAAGLVVVSLVVIFVAVGLPRSDSPGLGPAVSGPDENPGDYWPAGWGPERETFTFASGGASYPVFNSITDNPDYGDERNFVTIKAADDNRGAGGWSDEVWASLGDEFVVRIYGVNTGSDEGSSGSASSLEGARAAYFTSDGDGETSVGGVLTAKNAVMVWDGAVIHHDPAVRMEWDFSSAKIITNATPEGAPLLEDPFSVDGALIGNADQDGIVDPGYAGSFYVVATVRAVAADVPTPTAVHRFLPPTIADQVDESDLLVCAPMSWLSPRADALRCIEGELVLDPCFQSDRGNVSCPGLLAFRVPVFAPTYPHANVSTLDITLDEPPTAVTLDQAVEGSFPWAIRLADRGPLGQRWACVLEGAEPVFPDNLKYVCTGYAFAVSHKAESLEMAQHLVITEYTEGTTVAMSLDRSGAQWTVALQDPDTNATRRVAVTEAWF